MTRTGDAHYLHPRAALTPVVRPPVRDVSAIAWLPDGHLVVGTRAGEGFLVHPVHGTRPLWSGRGAALGLAADARGFVVVEADGRWRRCDPLGAEVLTGTHRFVGPVEIQTDAGAPDTTLMCGPSADDRRLEVVIGVKRALRVLLPDRTTAVMGVDVRLARATADGLEVIAIDPDVRFSAARGTRHQLSAAHGHVLGVSTREVRVWSRDGGLRGVVRAPEARSAAIAPDGRTVAVGCGSGGVGLAPLADGAPHSEPDLIEVSDAPVQTLAFSHRGRWLASGADRIAIWSWDLRDRG